MKRLLAFAITMFLSTGLIFAQADKPKELNPQPLPPGRKASTASTTTTDHKGGKKGHKGGKKGKKSSGGTVTPPPK